MEGCGYSQPSRIELRAPSRLSFGRLSAVSCCAHLMRMHHFLLSLSFLPFALLTAVALMKAVPPIIIMSVHMKRCVYASAYALTDLSSACCHCMLTHSFAQNGDGVFGKQNECEVVHLYIVQSCIL
mmetsp:Transcript_17919/g.36402  ORF Transcript_17919/g.36402 Transcript_17919/m.36402 type:complete len:126 (+) Transcript_17919:291-668(+)